MTPGGNTNQVLPGGGLEAIGSEGEPALAVVDSAGSVEYWWSWSRLREGSVTTRAAGDKSTVQGFTSISDGQPYTTDPAYAAANVEYRKFQNMDPITEFKKSGRV